VFVDHGGMDRDRAQVEADAEGADAHGSTSWRTLT
jgi:hypothetical protein